MSAGLAGSWVTEWLPGAKRIAHLEANHVDYRTPSRVQATMDRLRPHCRHKIRLSGWTSAVTLWYTVDVVPSGERWRHLSLQVSVETPSREGSFKAQLAANKAYFLDLMTPVVRAVYPFHDAIAANVRVSDAVPVHRGRQVMLRNPVTFDYLVRHDTTDGIAGVNRGQHTGRAPLLGPDGNPIRSRDEVNLATDQIPLSVPSAMPSEDEVDRARRGPLPPAVRGDVIALEGRRARRRRARRDKKKKR